MFARDAEPLRHWFAATRIDSPFIGTYSAASGEACLCLSKYFQIPTLPVWKHKVTVPHHSREATLAACGFLTWSKTRLW